MNCLLCGQALTADYTLAQLIDWRPIVATRLCASCLATFAPIDPKTRCPGCGRSASPRLCQDCQRWRLSEPALLHHRAPFAYNDAMKDFIQQYKGQGDYRLHAAFADVLQGPFPRKAALVPLVSEPSHLAARGFDPVLGLFAHLSLHKWLVKTDTALAQAQKDRAERLKTPQSFRCIGDLAAMQRFREVVLLDDLYTTGRTMYHAAAALRAGGFTGRVTSYSLIR